jgi:hypothetical protein
VVCEARVELPTRTPACNLDRGVDSADPVERLHDVGDDHYPGSERDLLADELSGRALAIPALEDVLKRIADVRPESETHCELPRDQAVRGLHRRHPLVPGQQQRPDPEHPPPRRTAPPDASQGECGQLRTRRVDHLGLGPQRDVIPEPRRLLVRVGMAAQPRQQRDVVDDSPLGFVETDVFGQAQAEHA